MKTKQKTFRKALEEIAMLRKTSGGLNESCAISMARNALGIQGENFEAYKKRKPLGIDTFLLGKMSESCVKTFIQDIQDLSMEIEARLLPDDIETRKQYIENLNKLIKELADVLLSKSKKKPINMAVVLATVGIAIATTNEYI